MAWAEKQRSGRYAGKYRDAGGTPRSVGTFTRKAEAEREAAVMEDRVRRDPTAIDPRDGRMTWGRWCALWRAQRRNEPTTTKSDDSWIDNRLLPRWRSVPLIAIRREHVQQWISELTDDEDLSASSVIHCYRLLSNSLKIAVVEKRLSVSPCVEIKLPTPPDSDERFLSHAEVTAIASVLGEPYRLMVLLLVGTGMRWGEAAGLHWARVDLAGEAVDVVETWDGAARQIKPYTKGKQRRRVYLPRWLLEELHRHRLAYPPTAKCGCRHRNNGRCRSGLVVPGVGGVAMDYHNFRIVHWGRAVGRTEYELADGRRFAKRTAARAAARGTRREPVPVWSPGLARVDGVPIEHATIHALRHTFASWTQLADPPLPLYDLSRLMGHHSIRVTERYAHLAPEARGRQQRALAWPGSPPSAMQTPCAPDPADTA